MFCWQIWPLSGHPHTGGWYGGFLSHYWVSSISSCYVPQKQTIQLNRGTLMTGNPHGFYRSTSPRFNKSKRRLGPKLSLPDTSLLLPRIQAERCVDCSEGCPKSVEALRPIQKCCFIIISRINPIHIMVGCQTILILIYIYTYHTSSIQLGLQVDANMSSMSKMSSPIPPAPGVADQLQPSTRAGGAVQRPWPQSGRSKVDLIYIYI
jgi:hypothetical protein